MRNIPSKNEKPWTELRNRERKPYTVGKKEEPRKKNGIFQYRFSIFETKTVLDKNGPKC
jgi:hypothetical protein